MQQILRLWFLATAVLLASAMIWAFVPVLVPILALTAALAALVFGIVAFARWLERARGPGPGAS